MSAIAAEKKGSTSDKSRTILKDEEPFLWVRKATTWEWDSVYRRVKVKHLGPGWRTGKRRTLLLECGHQYTEPASRPEVDLKECIYCMALWRWHSGERGCVDVEYALHTVTPVALRQIEYHAKRKALSAAPEAK